MMVWELNGGARIIPNGYVEDSSAVTDGETPR
ncbi:hypothetical protein Htur_3775 [Haloterrigena turkmenica DSM 5511]|uniref:Uncharacterized protein n=1 Tax=Haloterrigena turkmenica (strain ATCC 51198 / DSM 5511 / JCM 9101 / NCIMB 13204 / VKM B-1734 / 4k) TaxID=543526 RepID=D2RSE8_HALTV|nr:hypothetical protein Htur_3775 [Haloterrigena turkmenica DSM 5511]